MLADNFSFEYIYVFYHRNRIQSTIAYKGIGVNKTLSFVLIQFKFYLKVCTIIIIATYSTIHMFNGRFTNC